MRCHRGVGDRSSAVNREANGELLPCAISDRETFASLYPTLRRFAAVVADLDIDPDDLVQDALASTLRRHELHELDQPLAYLKRAIVHAASNHRRRAGRFRRLLPNLASDPEVTDTYPSDLASLDVLSPIDRAVVFLADVEGETFTRVADELGITEAAARKRASRGRAQLRKALGTELTAIDGDAT